MTATRNAVTGFIDIGAAASDPTLMVLKAQLEKQEAALLRKKAPTTARRKTALVTAMDLFVDRQR